tara:strand:- start:290 stop:544 length:255 start_codon:yes stop_codon:yes gene_type:complete
MARNYRSEYDNYHSSPAQKKRRAARNKVRRKMMRAGKAKKGDGKDVHHIDGNPLNDSPKNIRMESKKSNRSFPRTRTSRKKKVK